MYGMIRGEIDKAAHSRPRRVPIRGRVGRLVKMRQRMAVHAGRRHWAPTVGTSIPADEHGASLRSENVLEALQAFDHEPEPRGRALTRPPGASIFAAPTTLTACAFTWSGVSPPGPGS